MFKRISFILLALFVLGGTVGAFAYWDNLTQTQNETITIGQGVTLTVAADAVAPAGKVLVPAGVVLKANDVTSIVLTYNVALDLAAVTALNLSVTSSNVKIGGATDNASLVNIAIDPATSTVNTTNVVVTVTVTLTQPVSQEIYDLIKTQLITFDLTFTATQP